MSIKAIMESPGQTKRSYRTGHTMRCFKCNLWVRWLSDSELCAHCMKANGLKENIRLMGTPEALAARGSE